MSFLKVAKEDIELKPVADVPRWIGSNIAEIFAGGGDVRMAAGIHEILRSETLEPNPVVDDLLYILEGEIEVRIGDRSEVYHAGDFAYLSAGPARTYVVSDRVKLVYVTYPSDWQGE